MRGSDGSAAGLPNIYIVRGTPKRRAGRSPHHSTIKFQPKKVLYLRYRCRLFSPFSVYPVHVQGHVIINPMEALQATLSYSIGLGKARNMQLLESPSISLKPTLTLMSGLNLSQ